MQDEPQTPGNLPSRSEKKVGGPLGIIFFLNNREKVKILLNSVLSEKYGIHVPASVLKNSLKILLCAPGFAYDRLIRIFLSETGGTLSDFH